MLYIFSLTVIHYGHLSCFFFNAFIVIVKRFKTLFQEEMALKQFFLLLLSIVTVCVFPLDMSQWCCPLLKQNSVNKTIV